jgi:integrase
MLLDMHRPADATQVESYLGVARGSTATKEKEHPRVKAIKQRETGIGRGTMDYCKSVKPRDPLGQIGLFFELFRIPAAIGRPRTASFGTRKAYIDHLSGTIKGLRALNINIVNLDELTTKQLRRLFQEYEKQERSSGWMANVNTVLRRFGIWIGKPDLCPVLEEMVSSPNSAKRIHSAVTAKDWEQRGVDIELALQRVEEMCEITGLQLRLAKEFGVRLQEFIMFRVHRSLRIPGYLEVLEGAKGGRLRSVPIETDEQRELIERVKVIADQNPKGLLMAQPGRSLRQAIDHAYYLLKKAGITKAALGISAHGLRHGYACRIYKQLTGEEAPVMGGGLVDPVTHRWAIQEITIRLGHSRNDVVTAYIGSHANIDKFQRKNLERINGLLEQDAELAELALDAGIGSIYLIGPAADGAPAGRNQVLPIGFTAKVLEGEKPLDAEARAMGGALKVGVRVGQLLGSLVTLMPLRFFPTEIATFEIFLNVNNRVDSKAALA